VSFFFFLSLLPLTCLALSLSLSLSLSVYRKDVVWNRIRIRIRIMETALQNYVMSSCIDCHYAKHLLPKRRNVIGPNCVTCRDHAEWYFPTLVSLIIVFITSLVTYGNYRSRCACNSLSFTLIIIIIIAPLTIVSDDQWGDLECLYKACHAARTDGGLFTDTEVKLNDRVKMTVRWKR